jgi:hypothetical protein
MTILSPSNNSPSFLDQLRQFRADTATLQSRAAGLSTEYSTIQETAYDGYNQSHTAYDAAFDASNESASTDVAADGATINAVLPSIQTDQTSLTSANTQSLTDLGFCQSQVGQLAQRLTALAAAAPTGPVATSLQSALEQLNQGASAQNEVNFDATDDLGTTNGLLASITAEAAALAATPPGVDATGTARQTMADIQSTQSGYNQIADNAEGNGQTQLLASEYFTATVEWVDQAIGEIAPPAPTPPTSQNG